MSNLIQFEMPSRKSAMIKVIGVGGGGGNAVNYMHKQGIEGVDFVLCNTDGKALDQSDIPTKVKLGPNLTQGLGAGADPIVGENACLESCGDIEKILKDETKMVFITAGMGGGTGTGGAPVVSKIAKDMGILTVGIVTTPFYHEGPRRKAQAEAGIAKMRENVDTILVISNDKVRQQYGNVGFRNAFSRADDILATATKCITDIINSKGHMIVDFADVCTVMRNGGVAILGNGMASGDNRASVAIDRALNSPLLNDNNISGARWVLMNINSATGDHEFTLDEMDIISDYVKQAAGLDCDVVLGLGTDDTLGDAISVTVIATGFHQNEIKDAYEAEKPKPEDVKVILGLEDKDALTKEASATETTGEQSNDTANEVQEETPSAEAGIADELMPTLKIVEEAKVFPSLSGMAARPKPIVIPKPIQAEGAQEINKSEILASAAQIEAPTKITFEIDAPTTPEAIAPKVENIMPEVPTTQAPAAYELHNFAATQFISVNEQKVEPVQVQGNISRTIMPPLEPQLSSTISQVADDWVTIEGITFNRKRGSRYMTNEEIRDHVEHQQHMRRFEERASQLRTVSNVISRPELHSELENVPAYARSGEKLNDTTSTEVPDARVSKISIDANGNIDSKNEFLDGIKPD
jgi:cell division protein FtsZ